MQHSQQTFKASCIARVQVPSNTKARLFSMYATAPTSTPQGTEEALKNFEVGLYSAAARGWLPLPSQLHC